MPSPLRLPKAACALAAAGSALAALLAPPALSASPITPVKISIKPAGKTQITAPAPAKFAVSFDPFDLGAGSAGVPGLKVAMPFFGKPGVGRTTAAKPSLASLASLPHSAAGTTGPVVVPPGANFSGFNGLTNLDQASAGTGFFANTNFDLEPPDQGLAVGNGFVVEDVNNAIAIYNQKGKVLAGPTPMNQFFKLAPYAQPGFTPPFGPFLSDIRAYYDAGAKRFIVEEWGTVSDPGSGASVSSFIGLAVSDTADPTGTFTLYFINTTDILGTGVPSLPDYTYLGADANGIYLSSNYFGLTTGAFQGVGVLALSKSSLESGFGASGYVFPITPATRPADAPTFALAPSITPPGSASAASAGGTEFFADSLDPTGTTDTRLDIWALTNTSSLDTFNGSPVLSDVIVKTEAYGFPVPAQQKPGPTPLGTSLGGFPLETLATDDDRLFQLVYSNGTLWTANTTLYIQGQGPTGRVGDGIAYFTVKPTIDHKGVLTARTLQQGYVIAPFQDVIYPTIAVSPVTGNAVFSFTLTGPGYYPSAAYFDTADGFYSNKIHLASAGAAPEDGFTGYGFFGGPARWGDYSAAVTAEDGSIWLATEYIPALPRDTNANWGTFISHITTP